MPSLLFHSAFFNAPTILVFALVAILLAAAIYDIKTFTIPHIFSYLVIALFAINALSTGMSLSAVSWHFLSVVIAFAIGFLMFWVRVMGGGDVKLFAALALWFFPLGLIGLIFCITMTGVLISSGALIYKMKHVSEPSDQPQSIVDRFNIARKTRIPYGPAIGIGTLAYLILSKNLII